MNCIKCGHNKDIHKVFSDGLASCIHDPGEGYPLCGCSRTPKGIERDFVDAELAAWKAEALAAREYINKIDEFLANLRIDIQYVLPYETSVYLTAKVDDTQP